MAQAQRSLLPYGDNFDHLRDLPEGPHHSCLTPFLQHLLQLRGFIEVVLNAVLPSPGHENDLLDPGIHGFLNDVLNRGDVYDRQEFFWHGLGCREKTGSQSRDGYNCFFNLHRVNKKKLYQTPILSLFHFLNRFAIDAESSDRSSLQARYRNLVAARLAGSIVSVV